MKQAPVPMRRVEEVDFDRPIPGTFKFGESMGGRHRYLIFVCVYACIHSIPVLGHPKSWQWDGNEESPTVKPSIRDLSSCRWHGFITKGVLETCADSGEAQSS